MEERHVGILPEDIRGKFDLVLEGHDVPRHEIQRTREELNEKIDLNTTMIKALNEKIDEVDERLGSKIDAVAADLSDYRRDTELHSHCRVCEKP
jgi:vacuolar-type H+-ATPase subunit I/STV1